MKGTITISKIMNSDEVLICAEDKLSGTQFLRGTIKAVDFAEALFGRGNTPFEFELHPKMVGKKHENKTLEIYVGKSFTDLSEGEIRHLVAPYEREGWKADRDNFKNGHNYSHGKEGQRFCKVIFRRYVDPKETP